MCPQSNQSEKLNFYVYRQKENKKHKSNDWNTVHIIVKGNRMQHFINVNLMSDVTDNDLNYQRKDGFLGVQVHVGPPMKIEYKNMRIKNI